MSSAAEEAYTASSATVDSQALLYIKYLIGNLLLQQRAVQGEWKHELHDFPNAGEIMLPGILRSPGGFHSKG